MLPLRYLIPFSHFFILFITLAKCFNDSELSKNQTELFCKCMEYWECFSTGGQLYSYCAFSNEVCCLTNRTLNSETSLQNSKTKSAICGKKEFDSGIPEFAEPGEWAWHIAILVAQKELYICGGSLIDDQWVLTAAHCVQDYNDANILKVRIGEYDVSATNEPEAHEEVIVGNVFIHPKFNNNTLDNDIALLRLIKNVKKRPNINIVCLPDQHLFPEEKLLTSKCYITGWGKNNERGDHSFVLKEVNIPIWNHTKCEQSLKVHFGTNYNLSKTAICGGDFGHDACDGDGGGGLFCEMDQVWYQIGIISFGIGCGRRNSPGVYTNVNAYLDWIKNITTQQK